MLNKIRKNFTQVPNALINDRKLDRSARFLFVYLCSKPDDWTFRVTDIEAALGCSKDTRIKYVNELKAAGWMTYEQVKKDGGKYGEMQIILHATPQAKNSDTVPKPKNSAAEEDGGGKNTPHSNTDLSTNTDLFSNTENGVASKKLEEQILDYLNKKKPSKIPFKPVAGNLKHIKARIRERYVLENFIAVIDYKVDEWKGENKTRAWIRPRTLFGDKFDNYLVQAQERNPEGITDGSGNFEVTTGPVKLK